MEEILIKFAQNKEMNYKNITPNFIYNRFDIIYGPKADLIEIFYQEQIFYIPIFIKWSKAIIGVYLTNLPSPVFDKLIEFIFENYRKVSKISIEASINNYKDSKLIQCTNYVVNLPDNFEEYINNLPRKVRYNLRRRKERLIEEIGEYEIIRYDQNAIPENLVKLYFKFKKATHKKNYMLSPRKYLKKYFVTGLYALKINKKAEGILLISQVEKNIYVENITYNRELSKYGIGIILATDLVEDAILQKCENIFWGSYGDEYKSHICNYSQITYSGDIFRQSKIRNFFNKIFKTIFKR